MPEISADAARNNAPDPATLTIADEGTLLSSEYNKLAARSNDLSKAITDLRNAGHADDDAIGKLHSLADQQEAVQSAMKAELRAEKLSREVDKIRDEADRVAKIGQPAGDTKFASAFDADCYKAIGDYFLTGKTDHADPNVDQVLKAITVDTNTTGGYTITPTIVARMIEAEAENATFIRPLATKHSVAPGQAMRIPRLGTEFADADWTAEGATGTVDVTGAFAITDLTPYRLVKSIVISNDAMRGQTDVVQFVMSRLMYIVGITEEKAFLTGNGTGRPSGVFQAAADGLPTSRDVNTGVAYAANTNPWRASSTAGEESGDALINTVMNITQPYMRRARWVMHRDLVRYARLLKDKDGRYLWEPGNGGVVSGNAPTIAGYPYDMSEYAPNTLAANAYIAVFGDFSNYHIADATDVRILRSEHIFIQQDQTYFAIRKQTDAGVVIPQAFARTRIAA